MRLLDTTLVGFFALSISFAGPRATFADVPSKEQSKPSAAPAGTAALVQSVVDTVLEHHIDPPARQQMILTGVRALFQAAGTPVPQRLSSRVSAVTTPEQLSHLLDDIWPASTSKSVTIKELEEALLNGLLANVSGNAQLVPEKERKVQEQNAGNRYVGIHIALSMDEAEKRPSIAQVIEGGPADRAGVKSNDLIEQIEGVDTKGMLLRETVDRLRGDEGTSVTIKVRQPGAAGSRTFTIRRGLHSRSTIAGWREQPAGNWDFRMSDSDPIAYMRINVMAGSTPHELRKIALELEKQGIKAIVLDLRRGLGSNSAHTALLLADSLLDHGTIGRVRTSQGETVYQADSDAIFRGWPIAVLVDSNTSGAAEWLAAAIQDNHRGIVVGSPTSSARANPGNAVATSFVRVGNSDWSVSLTTGILERGDGRPVSAFDRTTRAPASDQFFFGPPVHEPENKNSGVHPDHRLAENRAAQAAFLRLVPAASKKADSVPDAAVNKAVEQLRLLLKRS